MTELDHRDHFQALFDSKYLRWFHLQGKDCLVTIEKVCKDVEVTMPGGNKEKKPMIHFVGKEKPLVMNKTNMKSIAASLGPKPSNWTGKQIVLYQAETQMYDRDTRRMETVPCIRVKGAFQKKTTHSSGKPSEPSLPVAESTTASTQNGICCWSGNGWPWCRWLNATGRRYGRFTRNVYEP
jgi:hypothetical protein